MNEIAKRYIEETLTKIESTMEQTMAALDRCQAQASKIEGNRQLLLREIADLAEAKRLIVAVLPADEPATADPEPLPRQPHAPMTVIDAIMTALHKDAPIHIIDLAGQFNCPKNTISAKLSWLKARGKVTNDGHGMWDLAK